MPMFCLTLNWESKPHKMSDDFSNSFSYWCLASNCGSYLGVFLERLLSPFTCLVFRIGPHDKVGVTHSATGPLRALRYLGQPTLVQTPWLQSMVSHPWYPHRSRRALYRHRLELSSWTTENPSSHWVNAPSHKVVSWGRRMAAKDYDHLFKLLIIGELETPLLQQLLFFYIFLLLRRLRSGEKFAACSICR